MATPICDKGDECVQCTEDDQCPAEAPKCKGKVCEPD
jgi:hypothetical protein